MSEEAPTNSGTTATGATAPAPPAPKQYFAHIDIVAEGKRYPAGTPLPADFPADSLAALLEDKSVGEVPPGKTTIVRHPTPPKEK